MIGTLCSVARVDFEVQLDPVGDAVVVQSEHVLERPLALATQHDLVRLPTDASCHHELELANGVGWQAWNRRLRSQPVVDMNDDHFLARSDRSSHGLLVLLVLLFSLALVPVSVLGSCVASPRGRTQAIPISACLVSASCRLAVLVSVSVTVAVPCSLIVPVSLAFSVY